MDFSSLVSGAGSSRWVPTVAGPKVIGHEVRKGKEQQLLQEAATMMPDSAALTKALMDHDIPYADLAPVQGQLQSLMNSYLEDYHTNPFNAFSKQSKDKVKMMQYIVNDPKLKQLAQENKMFKKHTEKVIDSENLGNNYNVKNGQIAVWRPNEEGAYRRLWIDPESLDLEGGDKVLTIADEVDQINNSMGLTGLGDEKYTVDMSSLDKLNEKLHGFFRSPGHTTFDQFDEGSGERIKSNQQQLDAALNAVTNGAGLSQADWNTLMSDYYSKNLGSKTVSKAEAKAWALDYIRQVKNKYVVGSDTAIKNPDGSVSGGGGEVWKNAQENDDYTLANTGKTGAYDLKETFNTSQSKGVIRQVSGNVLPEFFNKSANQITDENGDKVARLALSDNNFFNGKVMMRDNNTGQYKTIDYIRDLADAAVGDPAKDAGLVTMIVDPSTGLPVSAEINDRIQRIDPDRDSVPKDLQKYWRVVGKDENGDDIHDLVQKNFIVAHYNIIDRQTLNAGNQGISQFGNDMESMGYESTDLNNAEAANYQLHNKAGIDPNHFYYNSDQAYKVPIFIPVESDEQARTAAGGKVLITQQGAQLGTMGKRGYSNKAFIPSKYQTQLAAYGQTYNINGL